MSKWTDARDAAVRDVTPVAIDLIIRLLGWLAARLMAPKQRAQQKKEAS